MRDANAALAASDSGPAEPAGVPRDRLTTAGTYGVGLAAAAMSFDSLRGLGELVGFAPAFALLLPVSIDLYAMTATRAWLGRASASSEQVRSWARWNAWLGIAISVVGNAAYHWLRLNLPAGHEPGAAAAHADWKIVVAVSALPPIMLGLAVHLQTLISAAHVAPRVSGEPSRPPAGAVDVSRAEPVEPATPSRAASISRAAALVGERPAEPPRAGRAAPRSGAGSKREQLATALAVRLTAAAVAGERRLGSAELARELAPPLGLNEGTARRYIAELRRAELPLDEPSREPTGADEPSRAEPALRLVETREPAGV